MRWAPPQGVDVRANRASSRLHNILGYTNNALSPQQKAQALRMILEHAAAGRCAVDREAIPLGRASETWELQAAIARRKLILTP